MIIGTAEKFITGDRVIHHRRCNIDDAAALFLRQHLLDRKLADEEKAFDVRRKRETADLRSCNR